MNLSAKKKVSEDVLYSLQECVDRNVFFKGVSFQGFIEACNNFRDYCLNTFSQTNYFPIALFSFTQATGEWGVENINYAYDRGIVQEILEGRTEAFLDWLKKNYIPLSDFRFFYLPLEPYYFSWNMEPKIQEALGCFLQVCPLLISCNHPDLLWTKKGILIPDAFILGDKFHNDIDKLLFDSKKELSDFLERKGAVYFRGMLSGPKLPFSFDTIKENPRHYLVTKLHDYPYVDIGITNMHSWTLESAIDENYYPRYFLENFSNLKCDPVNFFEHAKNKYLLCFDGFGAAWSRLELIMATGSVLFLNAQCEQYFYPLMENNKTHVVINKDLSNLALEFYRLEAAPEEAQKIGEQGREFARKFFTQEAIDAYLGLVLERLEVFSRAL